nr:reverse transcriptase domain-containing protein [Tanacetum cinerariifolium]
MEEGFEPAVSPVHCVPKKGGFTIVENEENELIPTRLVTGWRVCIDYRKLNEATRKDHFFLLFMDQMLERLVGNQYYCFLDGFSGYFQIPIDPKDQEKTTFTYPYGTFSYRRMPLGLCNAPGTVFARSSHFFDVIVSGNPTPYYDPIVSTTSPTLTPFGKSDFLLEEVDAFLALEDDPTSPKVNQSYLDFEGDILLLEAFLNDDPSLPPPDLSVEEKTALIMLSLPDLSPTCMTLELADHSISIPVGVPEYVFVKVGTFHFSADFVVVDFNADPRVPLILERSSLKTGRALIDVFEGELTLQNYLPEVRKELKICEAKSNKSLTYEPLEVELKDLPTHLGFAFLEGDNKLLVIITKYLSIREKTALITVLKSYKRAIAWKLSDIKGIDHEFCTHKILMEEDFKPVVSPVYCLPKKGGFTVVENVENELILTCLVMGWWVCIDYRKLNEATRKDHFPLPFMDQMLERLAGNQYYCFLDNFSRYFQISIDSKDQDKTTFTGPYGTFAYRRMPFGLSNALGTFQRCMMAIFHDMIKKTIEVFIDDFLVFENSFQACLSHLEKMLKRCEDPNLCLNWEKSHFMVKEGIVLGHKISKNGIEVNKSKVDVIPKLPYPTIVKGIQRFLGHAGFYRRFMKDFSKIARPMTHLLEKYTPFLFSKECVEAIQTLKRKLIKAHILIAPD